MKLNLLKKLGIVGAAVSMMTTTAMAQAWTLNLNTTQYSITADEALKIDLNNENVNKRASFTRTDTSAMWTRTPFVAYTQSTSNSNHKSKGAEMVYASGAGSAEYVNYNSSFIGEYYKTYAKLSTANYSTYTISGTTRP